MMETIVSKPQIQSLDNNKIKRLDLEQTDKEDLLLGFRKDGKPYSVRKHRKSFFMPDVWLELMDKLTTYKAKLTADVLIQTGARINECRNIEERDLDYDRNTIRLRVTKTKARKKGEERGTPRTIPINSKFMRRLKKHFSQLPEGSKIGILTTAAFNIRLKDTLKAMGKKDYYMFSAHSVRKTHGNWLKTMGNAKLMDVDSSEICLRAGHDMNTYMRDYGSPSAMNSNDHANIKLILGDLYAPQSS